MDHRTLDIMSWFDSIRALKRFSTVGTVINVFCALRICMRL